MRKILLLILFVLIFSNEGSAQCTITGSPNVNSGTISCATLNASGCTTIYVGDGINPTNLVMNANLDLTCLGAIQFIVRNNAYIDFSSNNFDLKFAANSSIVVEAGGNIGSTSNCSASDLIKIGGVNVASCNGGGSGDPISFPTLVSGGGFNTVIASATSICGSGTSTITASKTPAPTASTTYNFYTVATGGSAFYTVTDNTSPYTATYTTGILSSSTNYYIEAVTAGVTTLRKLVTVTVNPIPATPSVTLTQPTCSVSTGTITISSPTGSGMTYSRDGSTYTNTTGVFTAVPSGTFSVTAKSSAGCVSAATSITINAQPITPVQPTLGSLAQPTCSIANGTFTITNYNAAYTYAASPSTGVSFSGSSVTAPPATYTITATLGSCTSVASSSITISSQPTNTWNGTVWSNGTPTSAQKLVFSGNYSSTGNIAGCSCQVTSGSVVFNAGHTLSLVNDVKVTGGSLTFANNASLVQTDDTAINSGNITYNRTTRAMTRWAYVYWGSPVEGNVFGQIPSQFDLGYRWQSGTMNGTWLDLSSTSLGEGFITRVRDIAPFSSGTGTINFSFTGKPNNGVINVNVDSYDSSSLVPGNTILLANPYPSAIDATKFLQHSNNTELGGTLFFWTAVTLYSGSGAYNVQDYGSWNLTGGTAPVTNTSLVPNGKIAAGQGFFSQIFADGTISFNNAMRETGNNTQFFKSSSVATESSEDDIERNRIWLNLSGESTLRQMLLGYVTDATNGSDRLYDGDSFTSNEIDIYSVLDNRNLVIQGRSLPFTATDIVPIGYRVTTAGNYNISIANTDGIFAGDQNVYLLDKTTGIYHDLKAADYTFATTNGIFNDRFEIRYTTQALSTDTPVSDNDIKVVSNNNGLSVYCASTAITNVQVFDVLGKLLFNQKGLDTNALETIQLQSAPQMLLVKVTLDNGQTYTKKTLIQ